MFYKLYSNARLLFRYTLAYLPLLLVFMYATKKDVHKKEQKGVGRTETTKIEAGYHLGLF